MTFEGENTAKPYQTPHFSGPKSATEYYDEAANCTNHRTFYFDKRFERSRELLIFMEETKIWQDVLQDCINRAGVNASGECAKLHDFVNERTTYLNSNFNRALRPKNTPGIPSVYEQNIVLSVAEDPVVNQ